MRFIDMTGQKFGMLTVICRVENNSYNLSSWLVQCDCGKKKAVAGKEMRRGAVVSCGCRKVRLFTKHNMSRSRPYRIWSSMIRRCVSPKSRAYPNYGGRGIKVCSEWKKFEAFWSDMKEGYSDDLTLDRIDVNGGYGPDNCRWATKTEQCRNTRRNRHVTYQGTVMTLAEAAERSGINVYCLRNRLEMGLTGQELFGPPLKAGRKKIDKPAALAVIEAKERGLL